MMAEFPADLGSIARDILHAGDDDIPRFLGFFTDGTTFRMANNEPVVGVDAIQGFLTDYLKPVLGTSHEIHRTWQAGDTVVLHVTVTYRLTGGRRATLPAMTQMRLADGKLTEYLIFMDPTPVTNTSASPRRSCR